WAAGPAYMPWAGGFFDGGLLPCLFLGSVLGRGFGMFKVKDAHLAVRSATITSETRGAGTRRDQWPDQYVLTSSEVQQCRGRLQFEPVRFRHRVALEPHPRPPGGPRRGEDFRGG